MNKQQAAAKRKLNREYNKALRQVQDVLKKACTKCGMSLKPCLCD